MTVKQIKDQSIHELNLIKRDYDSIKSDVESSSLVKEVEKRFIKLFSKSNAVKILVEPDQGYIVDANAKACQFYGYTLHELQKKKIIEINKLTEDEVIEEYKRQQDEGRDYFINKQVVASGSILPVEVRSTQVLKGGLKLFYFLIHEHVKGTADDNSIEVKLEKEPESLTEIAASAPLMFAKDLDLIENNARELVTLTQKLTVSEAKLRELNASKDRFFSIISHDLKNNFASILGLSRLLTNSNQNVNSESRLETATLLHSSSQKLYSLLENLLEWAKLQREEISFGPSRFGLKNTAREAIELFKLKADEKSIELIDEIPEDAAAFADQNMIKTVLRNLISNAINFTDSNGKIVISAAVAAEKIIVKVSDTGVGINKENQDKLFKIGEKFIGLTTEGTKGTGLGLILCKEFVEKNNGEIWVESEPGKGSTFYFSMPV